MNWKKIWTMSWRVLNMVGSAAAGNFSKCFQFWISAQEKPAKLFSNYFNSACYKLQFLLAINYNFCLELISLHWIQNRLFSIWESWNKSHSCCHVVKFLSCCHVVKVKRKKRREFQKMRIWRILLEKLLWRGITCFIYDIWEILDGYFIS